MWFFFNSSPEFGGSSAEKLSGVVKRAVGVGIGLCLWFTSKATCTQEKRKAEGGSKKRTNTFLHYGRAHPSKKKKARVKKEVA